MCVASHYVRAHNGAMRRLLVVLFAASCYRGPDPSQPEPLVLYTSGPQPPSSEIATEPAQAQPIAASAAALILVGSDTVKLDASGAHAHAYDRICVQDRAHIEVDGSTRIRLTSDRTTVIGGAGIGPLGATPATIEIAASGAPEIFVLFDNARAPIRAVFDTPNSTVHVGITGKTGLDISGKTCAEGRRALAIDEIENAVRELGYVSKAKSIRSSIRRVLRGDQRFKRVPAGHWTLRAAVTSLVDDASLLGGTSG